MTEKVKRSFFYLQNILALKKNDFFLVSFPKSGNTWVRFYLLNLYNQVEEYHFSDELIDFETLDTKMPELGQSDLSDKWFFEKLPRIIKTHLPYNIFFGNHKTILVVRDPRDVMVSFYNFEKTRANLRFHGDIHQFIRSPEFGIYRWIKHYLSWKNKAGIIIKYEDLKRDDKSIFGELNNFLQVNISEELFNKALELSRFENIKKVEGIKGLSNPGRFSSDFKFARSGKSGQWKDVLSEDDVDFINDLLKKNLIDIYS